MSNWCVSEDEAREAAASYRPDPDGKLTNIQLPEELESAVDAAAKLVYDKWAASRMDEGWTFGLVKDDHKREDPNLVPFDCLADGERTRYEETAEVAILALLLAGFKIIPPPAE